MGKTLNVRVAWEKEKFPNGCVCDIAFYTMDGIKIFAFQSHKFMDNQVIPPYKSEITFNVENIGLVNRDIYIDVGLKEDIKGKYKILVENAYCLSVPALGLYDYKVDDTIVVPRASVSI